MKSIFLTFLMFIVVFGAIHLGFIDLITNRYIPYISYGLLFIVIAIAIFIVGVPQIKLDNIIKEKKRKK